MEHNPSNTRYRAAVLLGKQQRGFQVERQVIISVNVLIWEILLHLS